MVQKFSLLVRLFWIRIFARIAYEPSQVQDVLAIPRNESIVYLIKDENKYDFLYFNYLCLKTGMPLAYASNGKSHRRFASLGWFIHSLFRRKKQASNQMQCLEDAVKEQRPILLFLNQYGRKEVEKREKTQMLLDRLEGLAHDSRLGLKIHYLPVGIIWERRAENYNHSLINELYGTPTKPSSVRRLISVLPGLLQLFFKIGKPLCLIHHYDVSQDSERLTGQTRLACLNDDIAVMHQQVNGPKIKPHQQILKEIVTDERFLSDLIALAQVSGQSQEALVKEARSILNKTAAKFSLLSSKIMSTLLTPMWSTIYNGLYVDTEQLNAIRELSKSNRLVFIPSHKSHVDYMILSILLFQHGVMPPHVVAGENLNFFPLGSILKRGGAFFIRRSFRGDQLYTLCIRHYISKILHEGFPLEFFIEGGRSRTGQVLQPKFGIFRMIAQCVLEDPSLKVKLIPCAITYEKVIEDMAYKSELEGKEKKKENITNLIQTTKLLISKYGQLYVSFAEAIDLNEALKDEKLAGRQSLQDAEPMFSEKIATIATELMHRINQASTITTSALLSLSLLNARQTRLSFEELKRSAAFFLAILVDRNALLSPVLTLGLSAFRATIHQLPDRSDEYATVSQSDDSTIKARATITPSHIAALAQTLDAPLLEALKLFSRNGSVKLRGNKQAPELEVDVNSRLLMAFYKNTLLFAILDEIYLACTILSLEENERTTEACRARFSEIADFFSLEFSNKLDFDLVLSRFEERHWLDASGEHIVIGPETIIPLQELSRCLGQHITSYADLIEGYQKADDCFNEATLLESLLTQSKTKTESKQCPYPESGSKLIYSHALTKLQQLGYCDVSYDSSGRKAAKILTKKKEIPIALLQFIDRLKV